MTASNKLLHYIHCPFCVRVRLALGFLEVKYDSIPSPYNDEETPLKLMGVKMLPIMTFEDGTSSNESLDIIANFDVKDALQSSLLGSEKDKGIEELLSKLGGPIHNLVMPYWVWTKEFNDESREYFQKKKEAKRGPFNELVQKQNQFLTELYPILREAEEKISPYWLGSELSIFDIMLASHLWGMYVYPEFQFSPKLHNYLQDIKKLCHFNYHEDFWKTNKPLFS